MNAHTATLTDLNRSCYCFPIERKAIDETIIALSQNADMASLLKTRENYFASTAVFLTQDDFDAMQAQINAIEHIIKTAPYQQAVFERETNTLHKMQPNTSGAFMGYDFHITDAGPKLIEINSNAGGAFIVNALEKAVGHSNGHTEASIAEMFVSEWNAAGRKGRPRTLAIIDENPEEQFHYPDMLLAAESMRQQGFEVIITDPKNLSFDGHHLRAGGIIIDLVYNRLTDFSLTETANIILRRALEQDAVVLTPSPKHHALYADKRNLVWLSDPETLSDWDVPKKIRDELSNIPKTIAVTPRNAEELWANRKQYFFKPEGGFGSRGTYRGAKLTTKVWKHITAGGYIAQKFVPPPLRAVTRNTEQTELKFDVRVYTYKGAPLLLAARMYQGQTTNLRTEGGGLAPVVTLDSAIKVSC